MTRRNYRGRFEEGGDIGMRAQDPGLGYRRRAKMQRDTIHKAVAAFLTSLVTILVSIGVVMPEWVTDAGIQNVSWVIATVWSLVGSGLISGVVYAVSNKPRGPSDGPMGS